jgi:hypothetical protein
LSTITDKYDATPASRRRRSTRGATEVPVSRIRRPSRPRPQPGSALWEVESRWRGGRCAVALEIRDTIDGQAFARHYIFTGTQAMEAAAALAEAAQICGDDEGAEAA